MAVAEVPREVAGALGESADEVVAQLGLLETTPEMPMKMESVVLS